MYATVAHDIYNDIVMEEQQNVKIISELLPALNNSIWKVSLRDQEKSTNDRASN